MHVATLTNASRRPCARRYTVSTATPRRAATASAVRSALFPMDVLEAIGQYLVVREQSGAARHVGAPGNLIALYRFLANFEKSTTCADYVGLGIRLASAACSSSHLIFIPVTAW